MGWFIYIIFFFIIPCDYNMYMLIRGQGNAYTETEIKGYVYVMSKMKNKQKALISIHICQKVLINRHEQN